MLSDCHNFNQPVKANEKVQPISLTNNSFVDNIHFTMMAGEAKFAFEWTYSSSEFSATIYSAYNNNDIYYQFKLNGGCTYNNINYYYNAHTLDQTLDGMRFFYGLKIAPDSLIESNNFFSFSMAPNFLRVQTDHSLIHYILFKCWSRF